MKDKFQKYKIEFWVLVEIYTEFMQFFNKPKTILQKNKCDYKQQK